MTSHLAQMVDALLRVTVFEWWPARCSLGSTDRLSVTDYQSWYRCHSLHSRHLLTSGLASQTDTPSFRSYRCTWDHPQVNCNCGSHQVTCSRTDSRQGLCWDYSSPCGPCGRWTVASCSLSCFRVRSFLGYCASGEVIFDP